MTNNIDAISGEFQINTTELNKIKPLLNEIKQAGGQKVSGQVSGFERVEQADKYSSKYFSVYLDEEISEHAIEMLPIMIESEVELEDYKNNFHNVYKDSFFAIEEYRKYILGKRCINKEGFLEECRINLGQALKRLFLRPISFAEIEFLKKRIMCGKITLDKLFDLHILAPEKRITRLIT